MDNPLVIPELVSCNDTYIDPAIDLNEPEPVDGAESQALSVDEMLAKYIETRDPKDIRLLPGMTPALFVLKPIPSVFLPMVLETLSPTARVVFAFLASCHEIKLPVGPALKPKKLKAFAYGVPCADEKEWLGTVMEHFPYDTIKEMGSIALDRVKLGGAARSAFRSRRLGR